MNIGVRVQSLESGAGPVRVNFQEVSVNHSVDEPALVVRTQ